MTHGLNGHYPAKKGGRRKAVAGSELRIGAEVVGSFPEIGFEFFDVLECINH